MNKKTLLTLTLFFSVCPKKLNTRYSNNFKDEQAKRTAFWRYWVDFDKITIKQYPEIYKRIGELSKKVGIARPIAFVYKNDAFVLRNNAAAISGGLLTLLITKLFSGGIIFIGSDLVERCTEEELDFIIAHELSHLRTSQIIKINTTVAPLSFISTQFLIAAFFGSIEELNNKGFNDAKIGKVLSFIVMYYFVSTGLSIPIAAITRHLEKDADLHAVKATKDKESACAALEKIERRFEKYFPCASHREKFWEIFNRGIFRTHPTIENRCKYIDEANIGEGPGFQVAS